MPTRTSTWRRNRPARWLAAAGALSALLFLPACAALPRGVPADGAKAAVLGGVLAGDLALSGPATLAEDLLVPAGVTLTLLPGTVVTVVPADGTLTNPAFLLSGTEIMVHGAIRAPGGKVAFRPAPGADGGKGSWGGIVLGDPSARAELDGVSLEGAENGVLDFRSPPPAARPPVEISFREDSPVLPPSAPRTREYTGEAALTEDTVWSGEVVVDGQVAVPPGVTLTIRPGTRVLFRPRDTDGDRLGESWIVVQGRLRVEGAEDAWVLFDSTDPQAGPGAWDSVSLISSDAPDNLVRYAAFRRAVKGFHDHFSRVAMEHVAFTDNLRGLQFQESEGLILDHATFLRNRSALRFRDSTASLSNLAVQGNVSGANFLRSRVTVRDSLFSGNRFESLQSREAETSLTRTAFVANRQGPRFKGTGGEAASLDLCLVQWNHEDGLSLQRVAANVARCEIADNGEAGLSVTDAAVTVRGSRLAGNGKWEVDNNGSTEVDAEGNDWGRPGGPEPARISGGRAGSGAGAVRTGNPLTLPFRLAFPGSHLPLRDFAGTLVLAGDVTLELGLEFRLLPGARALFAAVPAGSLFDLCSDHPSFPGAELLVAGRLAALGATASPVVFGPLETGAPRGSWGAVNLLGAEGGEFRHALFTGADTGLHVSGTPLARVDQCRFEGNVAGLRFSGSRVLARGSTFRDNRYGIRFHGRGGEVADSEFYANETAIFVTDDYSDTVFSGNTFGGSVEYDVKLGEGETSDLDMRRNRFLPRADGRAGGEMVFDESRDTGLGRVLLP